VKFIKYRLAPAVRRKVDDACMKLAWLLPKRVAMWAAIRVGVHATTGDYSSQVVPELAFTDALQRWETA
jgi:hypothetical protein